MLSFGATTLKSRTRKGTFCNLATSFRFYHELYQLSNKIVLAAIPLWYLAKMIILGLAACAAGAQKRGEQALGLSRGGLSSKNHVIVDGLGNPLRFRLTAGQAHDITQAQSLIEGLVFERVIAAQDFVDKVPEQGSEVVILPHPRTKAQHE